MTKPILQDNGLSDLEDYKRRIEALERTTGTPGSTGSTGPAGPNHPLVTTLPVAPTDGTEVYFQTTTMATSGTVWHLRYRAASASVYKWEYVGGGFLERVGSATSVAANTVTTVANSSLTLPLSGDWLVSTAGLISSGLAATGGAFLYGRWAAGGLSNAEALAGLVGSSSTVMVSGWRQHGRSAVASGTVIDMQAFCYIAADFSGLTLGVRPVRVS